MNKPGACAHKEMNIFCCSYDQVWCKFSVLII